MSNTSDSLIDDSGTLYHRTWNGGYEPDFGFSGEKRDVNFWGQPNIQQGFFGPQEARDPFGRPILSVDGRPLYLRPPDPTRAPAGDGAGTSSGLDDAIAFGLAVLCIAGIGLAFYLLYKAASALIQAWSDFEQQYPRTCLALKLGIAMALVAGSLALAGFDAAFQISGALLVLGLWGWLRLTRGLPLIFLPINAFLLGGGLWLLLRLKHAAWQPVWGDLTAGLPLIGDLAVVLGATPLVLLLLTAGTRRYPLVFTPIDLLGVGLLAAFLCTRVWPGWLPIWERWTAPLPPLPPVALLICLAPVTIWLWTSGQARWPVPFFVMNLLLFGGLLSLTAYQYQPVWRDTWQHWSTGTAVASMPFAMITATPASLWVWSRASLRWPRVFALPNQILSGLILWLIADRTRPLWTDPWLRIWGDVPLTVDPALVLLGLPLAIWTTRQATLRWRLASAILRLVLLSMSCWWLAERTRPLWALPWKDFAGNTAVDLALVALVAFPAIVGWNVLRRRYHAAGTSIGLVALVSGLWWLGRCMLPEAESSFRAIIAAIPLLTWGWALLVRYRRRLALLVVVLLPEQRQILTSILLHWIESQGVPLPIANP